MLITHYLKLVGILINIVKVDSRKFYEKKLIFFHINKHWSLNESLNRY